MRVGGVWGGNKCIGLKGNRYGIPTRAESLLARRASSPSRADSVGREVMAKRMLSQAEE